jgi:cyclopropane fatty-acyl-phospholipid synthase-like methyltransferase
MLLALASDADTAAGGEGWPHLNANYDVDVTGVILSKKHARSPICGMERRPFARFRDYRTEQGSYDRIVSVDA